MRSIWAVVRHTLAQCLRMKIAVAFILLLAAALIVLPLTVTSEQTLASRIRTFLYYSVSLTGLLLSLVTVLLSVAVITSDVHGKQIFTVATKPLARWQYLLGRWAGVVLLAAILLAISGGVIYGLLAHLRGLRAMSGNDRRVVETEIFTARRKVAPQPVDVSPAVARRIEALKNEGGYARAVEDFKALAGGDEQAARILMEDRIRQDMIEQSHSCGHNTSIRWEFQGVQTTGREIHGSGRVVEAVGEQGLYRIEAGSDILGQILRDTPVRIQGVETRAIRVGESSFDVQFETQDRSRPAVADLKRGAAAAVVVEPSLQIAYKLRAAGSAVDNVLAGMWIVENPGTGYYFRYARENVADVADTLTVPARVADDGRLTVTYVNLGSPIDPTVQTSVSVPDENISVLYRAGDFAANLLRGLGLILLMVMFLAALGTFMASFLSFPVATLICLVLLGFCMAGQFLSDSVKIRDIPGIESDFVTRVGHYTLIAMKAILPDYNQASPAGAMLDGMRIPWAVYWGSPGLWILLRVVVALAGACAIFHFRELARVQV